jgi:hypothetical protein
MYQNIRIYEIEEYSYRTMERVNPEFGRASSRFWT